MGVEGKGAKGSKKLGREIISRCIKEPIV
jgi:hypothetical protein